MARKLILSAVAAILVGVGYATTTVPVEARNIFNAMNPFKWFDDDDDYYYRRHRWYGPGYGGGPYGWGSPYGWGGPWGGWGYPPYYAYGMGPKQEAKAPPPPPLPE